VIDSRTITCLSELRGTGYGGSGTLRDQSFEPQREVIDEVSRPPALCPRSMNVGIPKIRSGRNQKGTLLMDRPIRSLDLLHSPGLVDPLPPPPRDACDRLGMLGLGVMLALLGIAAAIIETTEWVVRLSSRAVRRSIHFDDNGGIPSSAQCVHQLARRSRRGGNEKVDRDR